MKYYLVAGEASGDLHGANLMAALRKLDPDTDFRFFGGEKMEREGGILVKHYKEMAFMGFVEVVLNLKTILKNLKQCKEDLLRFKPDALVLIDFPGFNLKIAKFARKHGIRVCYYISPKVWAWNQKRVLAIKDVVDEMLCILPFEVAFYKSWGMDVTYVGNPLLDAISAFQPEAGFKESVKLDDRPVVALLPGSRRQEIQRLLPPMLAMADRFRELQFVVAGAPNFDRAYYEAVAGTQNFTVVYNKTYDLLHIAKAAVVASGTATLETAIFKVPQVVVYKGAPLSIAIARMVVKIKFISLVNLIADKLIVPELIQEACTPENIASALSAIISGKGREDQLQGYSLLSTLLDEPGASDRAAAVIFRTATRK